MATQGKVSVVISVLNESEIITDCLSPFLRQTRNPMEVILVDNGSTDDTPDKIRALQPAFRAKGIALELLAYGYRYYVQARAYGMSKVRGEIIGSIDADTVVADDWVEQVERSFEHAAVVGVGGGIYFRNRGPLVNWLTHHFPFVSWKFDKYTFWGLNCAYRKSAYDQVGGLDGYDQMRDEQGLKTIQDDTYLSRKLSRAGKVVFNPALKATALFRIHGKEPTHFELTRRIVKEIITMKKIESYFAQEGA